MMDLKPQPQRSANTLDALAIARERTPARLFTRRAGAAYRTETMLELRRDHAAARDAVQTVLRLADLPADLVSRFGLFDDSSMCRLRPDRRKNSCSAPILAAGSTIPLESN